MKGLSIKGYLHQLIRDDQMRRDVKGKEKEKTEKNKAPSFPPESLIVPPSKRLEAYYSDNYTTDPREMFSRNMKRLEAISKSINSTLKKANQRIKELEEIETPWHLIDFDDELRILGSFFQALNSEVVEGYTLSAAFINLLSQELMEASRNVDDYEQNRNE